MSGRNKYSELKKRFSASDLEEIEKIKAQMIAELEAHEARTASKKDVENPPPVGKTAT